MGHFPPFRFTRFLPFAIVALWPQMGYSIFRWPVQFVGLFNSVLPEGSSAPATNPPKCAESLRKLKLRLDWPH